MTRGAAFDVQAVCSGFIYGLAVADNFIKAGQAEDRAADRRGDHVAPARLDRPHDLRAVRRRRRRRSCCRPMKARAPAPTAACSTRCSIPTARLHDLLYVDGGPSSTRTTGYLRMKGKEVFRHAVTNIVRRHRGFGRKGGRESRRHRLVRAAPGQPAHPGRHRPQARRLARNGWSRPSPSTATPRRPRCRWR